MSRICNNLKHSKVTAYIGLGANLGDAAETLNNAIESLRALPETELKAISSLYGSAPIGEGADGPNYTNAVVQIVTSLSAFDLLDALQAIEQENGRVRSYRNAPRTLDLDILLYGDYVLKNERLTLPHPRMNERAFVLLPLSEIAPDLMWMDDNRQQLRVGDLLPKVVDQQIIKLVTD